MEDLNVCEKGMARGARHNTNVEFRPLSYRVSNIMANVIMCFLGGIIFIFMLDVLWERYTASIPEYQMRQWPSTIDEFQSCSIKGFLSTGLKFLDTASELPIEEFEERRTRLAKALVADGIDAFIAEPGYTFKYYANISQPEWEVWEPEERPFLMVVQPSVNEATGEITPFTRFLAPSFEVERARLLDMPFKDELLFVPWEEHWNPYETLRKSWRHLSTHVGVGPKIMVDDEMRDFIQRGLGENGEIEIIRAVNTGTVDAIRAMRKCMYPGLTENQVMNVLDATIRAAGLEPFFDIVLFDDNASNPHGGTNGSKILEAATFVLIDVGAHLYGYSSDVCRTFFPPFFPQPITESEIHSLPALTREKLKVWDIVLEAQSQSINALHAGNTAASVDIAARDVITKEGYGDAFTHRVGHGIGIKAHESPYLNKGNLQTVLKAGMTFTSEPGVYLLDKFGVRHEDIFLVKETGNPELLSGKRAIGPWDP